MTSTGWRFYLHVFVIALCAVTRMDCSCFWYNLHGGTFQCTNTTSRDLNTFKKALAENVDITHVRITHMDDLNRLTSEIFQQWPSNVSRVQSIDLSSNKIHVIEYYTFGGFSGVQYLNLAENNIEFISPQCLTGLEESLVILDLSYNQLAVLDTTFLSFFSRLRSLYLNNNLITSIATTSSIRRHPFLTLPTEYLNLSHNQLTNIPKKVFEILYRIEILDISYNKLEELNLTIFTNTSNNHHLLNNDYYPLSQLDELYLQHNQLLDFNIVDNLNYLPNLRFVQIDHNQLLCKDYNHILYVLINSHVNVTLTKTISGACVDSQNPRADENASLKFLAIDLDILIMVLEFMAAVMLILAPTFLIFYLVKWICFRPEPTDEVGLRFLK